MLELKAFPVQAASTFFYIWIFLFPDPYTDIAHFFRFTDFKKLINYFKGILEVFQDIFRGFEAAKKQIENASTILVLC